MADGKPLSDELKDALDALDKSRLAIEHPKPGQALGPIPRDVVLGEITRAETSVRRVLHLVAGQ